MGDFTGFTFNGYHTKDLGITRVSNGDRYEEDMIPEFEDLTIDIPGNDGSYYFGSFFKEKTFSISCAFDHLTEPNFRLLRRLFGNRNISTLIFDEAPYKMYKVRLDSPPKINYICFDERKRTLGEEQDGIRFINTEVPSDAVISTAVVGQAIAGTSSGTTIEREREKIIPYVYSDEFERIYKGELDITFKAYYPFAVAPYKDLDSYENYDNIEEWNDTANLKTAEELADFDVYKVEEGHKFIQVYNPGDLPSSFQLYIPFESTSIQPINFGLAGVSRAQMGLNEITRFDDDTEATGIFINTKNHLIEGVKKIETGYVTTGFIYNQFIRNGSFFKIPIDNYTGTFEGMINFSGNGASDTEGEFDILYDYVYY